MPTYTFQCPKCKNKGLKRVYEGSFSISKGKKVSPSCPTGVCPLPKRENDRSF